MTSKDEIEDTEAWLARLEQDDTGVELRDGAALRGIGQALDEVEAANAALVASVAGARSNGHSWTDVAFVLGVTRQAARQRFAAAVGEQPPANPAKKAGSRVPGKLPAKKVAAKESAKEIRDATKGARTSARAYKGINRAEKVAAKAADKKVPKGRKVSR
jgi:hypothetical protein